MAKSRLSRDDRDLLMDVVDRLESICYIMDRLEPDELHTRLKRIIRDVDTITKPEGIVPQTTPHDLTLGIK